MNSDAIRAALTEHTAPDALDDLRTQLDLTRIVAARHGIPDDGEREIRGALAASIRGAGTPAEVLQQLRSRWVQA